MGPIAFFVLFMGPTILFQLLFNFIYSTFINKFSIQLNKLFPNKLVENVEEAKAQWFSLID